MIEDSDNKKIIECLKQKSNVHLASMSFFLDDNFCICGFTTEVSDILLFEKEELLGKPLADFLISESRPVWENFLSGISREREYGHSLILSFRGKQSSVLPAVCLVSPLSFPQTSGSVLVTAIDPVPGRQARENVLHRKTEQALLPISLSHQELENIGKVQQYIALYLAEPYSSIKELAHKLGTSEFRLKYGFKQLYGITVFQYLQNERLHKAKYLIQHSGLSIKKIAKMTGFKSPTHFSKVFKDNYDHAPREFRKRFRGEKDD